MAGAAV